VTKKIALFLVSEQGFYFAKNQSKVSPDIYCLSLKLQYSGTDQPEGTALFTGYSLFLINYPLH